jgi:sialate O-acetylesterase
LASAFALHAEVRLPAIFCDDMVLQQQSEVAIWGWSKANGSVKVVGSWDNRSYTTRCNADGFWKVAIKTPVASFTPYTLNISDGKALMIKNILIGEVWLCSGQSNMEMPLKGMLAWGQHVEGAQEEILTASRYVIRCFTIERKTSETPLADTRGKWEIASPQTAPDFSATAWFFGKRLFETLGVPIGLINSSWGGSRIETWTSAEALNDLKVKAEKQNMKPSCLFNGMINPIVGYGIKGMVWYQGEANRNEPEDYPALFDAMVRDFRRRWTGDFPVYYCQIAPFHYYDGDLNTAFLREAQGKCMLQTSETGMAVLMDAASPECIHPAKKKDAGDRLAFWALAKTYDIQGIRYRSPEYKSMTTNGDVAIITFEMYGSLGLTSHGKELRNFQVAGKSRWFAPAKAVLLGNRVFLYAPDVAEPIAVRYCFDDASEAELFTIDANLPISSFRTDDW